MKDSFCIVLLSICLAISSADVASATDQSMNYFPMNVGMKWEYRNIANKQIDLIVSTKGTDKKHNVNVREWKNIIRIESDKIIDGLKYYKTAYIYSDMPGVDPIIIYRRLSSEGVFYMREGSKEYLEIPFPIVDGNTWSYFDPDRNTTVKCKAKKTDSIYCFDKTYPDGLLISKEYTVQGKLYNNVYYYANNIGLVKSIFNVPEQDLTSEANLITIQQK